MTGPISQQRPPVHDWQLEKKLIGLINSSDQQEVTLLKEWHRQRRVVFHMQEKSSQQGEQDRGKEVAAVRVCSNRPPLSS